MINIWRIRLGAAAVAAALITIPPAQAAKAPPSTHAAVATPVAHSLGHIDSWTAYATDDQTGKVCYVVGQAQKSEPPGAARQPPMAMVTHRPAEKIANVVSFVEGYPLKAGSDVTLDVGGSKFELFTKDDSAWARTSDLDRTIVGALARGAQVIAHGVPQRGPPTTDVYSLAGFGKALALIDKACGVRRDEAPVPTAAAPTPSVPVAAVKHAAHPAHHTRHAHRAPPPHHRVTHTLPAHAPATTGVLTPPQSAHP
jgi:hypothetical protein